jgi:ABC-2 type transport system ATP-binding protein
MSKQPAIEAVGIRKRYGSRDVLCDVDLRADPGRLHGLLGPNGAGKTTLMRVLLGLVRRDAGTVRLLGNPVDSTAGAVPDGVAGIVELPAFYPYLSGRDNLAVLARLDGQTAATRRVSIDAALDQVGLSAQAKASVSGYSVGMRQRLGLAAVLIRSPRLLFLDEPTTSLDPAGARDVRTLVRRLAENGIAVVLSSHDMLEVEELCATLTVINHGRVIYSGTVEELRQRAPAAIHALETNDDGAALAVASQLPGLKVRAVPAGGLEVAADLAVLDAFVIALGCAGIAVRALDRRTRSLESLFLELTEDRPAANVAMAASLARAHEHTASVVVS